MLADIASKLIWPVVCVDNTIVGMGWGTQVGLDACVDDTVVGRLAARRKFHHSGEAVCWSSPNGR